MYFYQSIYLSIYLSNYLYLLWLLCLLMISRLCKCRFENTIHVDMVIWGLSFVSICDSLIIRQIQHWYFDQVSHFLIMHLGKWWYGVFIRFIVCSLINVKWFNISSMETQRNYRSWLSTLHILLSVYILLYLITVDNANLNGNYIPRFSSPILLQTHKLLSQ